MENGLIHGFFGPMIRWTCEGFVNFRLVPGDIGFGICVFVGETKDMSELVENDEFRDALRRERADQQDFASAETMAQWGKETGADLMLFGDMNSETDTANKKRVVNYITTMYLTDLESNKRIWYGQREIKKIIH